MKVYSIAGRSYNSNDFKDGEVDTGKGLVTADKVFTTHRRASEYLLKDGFNVSYTSVEEGEIIDCYIQNHRNDRNEDVITFSVIEEHSLVD